MRQAGTNHLDSDAVRVKFWMAINLQLESIFESFCPLILFEQDSELLGVMATDVPVKDMNEFINYPLVSTSKIDFKRKTCSMA